MPEIFYEGTPGAHSIGISIGICDARNFLINHRKNYRNGNVPERVFAATPLNKLLKQSLKDCLKESFKEYLKDILEITRGGLLEAVFEKNSVEILENFPGGILGKVSKGISWGFFFCTNPKKFLEQTFESFSQNIPGEMLRNNSSRNVWRSLREPLKYLRDGEGWKNS